MMQYTLSNNILKISVNALGAELQSLYYLPSNLEFLWQGDKKYWTRQAPILFPIVGKLRNDELIHNSKAYAMSQHGFARDNLFKLISQNNSEINLQLKSNAKTKAIYPFDFELNIIFTLTEQTLTTTYQVHNTADNILPFSLGGHPAFNWPLMQSINKQDHQLIFDKNESTNISQLNCGLIKTKKTKSPLISKKLALDESLFINDALIFESINSNKVRLEGQSIDNTAFVEMGFSDFNDFGVWTKPGADFICLEPWLGYSSYEDFEGDFSEKSGLLHLAANKSASFSFDINVGVNT